MAAEAYQVPALEHAVKLLRFLKQQNRLYDLIRFHLNAVKRAAHINR